VPVELGVPLRGSIRSRAVANTAAALEKPKRKADKETMMTMTIMVSGADAGNH
jgi:hypothetical protein